jgi:hypothetical protein
MASEDDPLNELNKWVSKYLGQTRSGVYGGADPNTVPALLLVTEAIQRLDATSGELSNANLRLTRRIVQLTYVIVGATVIQLLLASILFFKK